MKGKLKEACPTCNHQQLKKVYEGPIRSAEPGSPYTDGYRVDECLKCSTIFLNPFPAAIKELYEEGEYWKARTDDLNKKEFVNKFIREQLVWLNQTGGSEFTGESVLDVGCGHGIFLDVIKNIAKRTAALDIDIHLKEHIEGRNHEFYTEWPGIEIEPFSRVVMFNTLEHIEDPINFLIKAKECLTKDGMVIVGVPNANDFMVDILEEYKPFFYRKGHLYYFNMESLTECLKRAGFKVVEQKYVHQYNLMNMVGWAKAKKPQGVPDSAFDTFTENSFISNVEREGIASHILIKAVIDTE